MACSTACPPRHDLLISENGNLATFDKVKKKRVVPRTSMSVGKCGD